MSQSSLYGIKCDFTGERLYDFSNSWLFAPIIFEILPEKYMPKLMIDSDGFIKNIMFDLSSKLWNKADKKIRHCKNTADRICWEIVGQQIFFTKDKELIADSIRTFVKQNMGYGKSSDDNIPLLKQERIVNRFFEIADRILELNENEYPFFVFQNNDCCPSVKNWFVKWNDETEETIACSMIENKHKISTEFVVIENKRIIRLISSLKFDYGNFSE